MKTQNQDKKGFTIIEVVLVLAIAGLIFLVVFLAVPALQRSQRDQQRRSDMGRFMSQITQYQSNNQGKVPSDPTDFVNDYMKVGGDTFADPSTGSTYVANDKATPTSAESNTLGEIDYYTNAECDGDDTVSAGGNNRAIAIMTRLEGGGHFCQDNS